MKNSHINWTDHTANFWWGCVKVSEGCMNCYAESLSKRYGKRIWGPAVTTERERKIAVWRDIAKWEREARAEGVRRRVFVSSMSDFLESHPMLAEMREDAMNILEHLEWLDVLILTKRPENAPMLARWYDNWPPHIWFGVSVENQARANERIPELLKVPVPIKFLSIEPQLGLIDLGRAYPCGYYCDEAVGHVDHPFWSYGINAEIKWVIVGGESGSACRPFLWDWARDLRDQCRAANVAFWMKQGGGYPDKRDNLEDLPEDLRIRELPEVP